MKAAIFGFTAIASLVLSACATIVGDKTQLIPIASTPDQADILITDEKGVKVFRGRTPTSVTLAKSDGSYWGKKSFVVTISKAGFQTRTIPITASANGWYIAGNIVFGGLIGWFIVDPFSGAMYTLRPDQITSRLDGKESSFYDGDSVEGRISIVLLQDLPPSLRDKIERVE